MQSGQLLTLVGIFAASLVMLLLVLRAIPEKSNIKNRLNRATNKASPNQKKRGEKSKVHAFDGKSQNQKTDFIFRTLGTDSSILRAKIRKAGLSISLLELFLIYVLAALGIATLATVVARLINDAIPLLYTVPAGAVGGFLAINLWLKIITNRRINAFNDHFPDAIELMVRCLRTGIPIIEMFKQAGENAMPPVSTEFQRIYNDIKFGIPLSDAIWRTAERMQTQEFIFFAISVSIQSETGGNLAENLEKLGTILRNRLQVKRMIKTKSAEARLTAKIFTFLPVVFISGLYFLSPSYIEIFLKDARGHTAGFIIGGMIVTGMFITNRMTKFGY